jgi:hypothetical protein
MKALTGFTFGNYSSSSSSWISSLRCCWVPGTTSMPAVCMLAVWPSQ